MTNTDFLNQSVSRVRQLKYPTIQSDALATIKAFESLGGHYLKVSEFLFKMIDNNQSRIDYLEKLIMDKQDLDCLNGFVETLNITISMLKEENKDLQDIVDII